MINVSPVLSALQRSSTPVIWHNLGDGDSTLVPNDIRESFRSWGFVRGVHFPVTDSRGLRGVVGLAGDRQVLRYDEVLELSMISLHVFNRLSDITYRIDEAPPPLSVRELECLKWTAGDKTSAEIAAILSLSEHTVNHYLISATRKLDAVNRTRAVANAIRRGWI